MKRKYSQAMKDHTIKLVLEDRFKIKEVAVKLGISTPTIYRWISDYKNKIDTPDIENTILSKKHLNQLEAENKLLRKAIFLSSKKEDIFEFIYENKDILSIQKQCEIFNVSPSGYYKHIKSDTSVEKIHYERVKRLVKEVYFEQGPQISGSKITEIINKHERVTSGATVARILKKHKKEWHQSYSKFHVDTDVVLNFHNKDTLFDQKTNTYYHNDFAKEEIRQFLNSYTLSEIKMHTSLTTEYIEQYSIDDNLVFLADNLHALHHLQGNFKNKVKLIYVDVPYNTKNENLSYKDSCSKSNYLLSLKNRLEMARKLLKRNGSIFIQCDDTEQAYIKVLCDEIFGIENFIHQIVWKRSASQQNTSLIATKKEYILVYAKNKKHLQFNNELLTEKQLNSYKFQDNIGRYRIDKLKSSKTGYYEYSVLTPGQQQIKHKWIVSEVVFKQLQNQDLIHWSKQNIPYKKVYLKHNSTIVPNDLWIEDEVYSTTRQASIELSKTIPEHQFTYPKPEKLLQKVIRMASNENDIVLDFYAGSGTTAVAAANLNRQFIGVELDEDNFDLIIKRLKSTLNANQSFITCEMK